MTHCLCLIYSSNSLYISQPSSINSHSLMINRAAALALPLTATCKLVTLNDSPMHRFHPRERRGSAWRAWRSGALGEKQRAGKVSKTRFCGTRLSIRVHRVAVRIVLKDRQMGTQIGANYVNSPSEPFFSVGTFQRIE